MASMNFPLRKKKGYIQPLKVQMAVAFCVALKIKDNQRAMVSNRLRDPENFPGLFVVRTVKQL
jgi:hypothetical protein